MGSVLSYSGISTKIRAMSSHLVTDEQRNEQPVSVHNFLYA